MITWELRNRPRAAVLAVPLLPFHKGGHLPFANGRTFGHPPVKTLPRRHSPDPGLLVPGARQLEISSSTTIIRPSTNVLDRMVIARKRPKGRLIRARVVAPCLYVLVIIVLFVLLASGFPYSISEAFWFPALIGLTAAFVLLMLPVAWKALDEDLARYRLARVEGIGGRKLFPYVGAGLALGVVMLIVTVRDFLRRNRNEGMQHPALPSLVALAA